MVPLGSLVLGSLPWTPIWESVFVNPPFFSLNGRRAEHGPFSSGVRFLKADTYILLVEQVGSVPHPICGSGVEWREDARTR